MPVHAYAPPVQEQWTSRALASCPVDGAAHRWWQGNEDDSAALAGNAHDSVPVFLTQVFDVSSNGLEDPQTQKSEQADEGEVERVARLPGGGEHALELQVR